VVEALVLTVIVVAFGLALAGFSLFVWFFVLPFRIVGVIVKLGVALVALPLLLLFGLLAAGVLGFGVLLLALPMVLVLALPVVLFAWMLGGFGKRGRDAARA
jgi:hypothetical protein